MKKAKKLPKDQLVVVSDHIRATMHQESKKAAGRLLDGRTHDGLPPGYEVATLTKREQTYLSEREAIVGEGLKQSIVAAKALHEIRAYEKGKLWKATHETFQEYCTTKWGYRSNYAFELADGGEIILDIEAHVDKKDSGIPEWEPTKLSHLRPLKKIPKEKRGECWVSLLPPKGAAELTAELVIEGRSKFAKDNKIPLKPKRPEGDKKRKKTLPQIAMPILRDLRDATQNMPKGLAIEKLLDQVEALFE